jgi:hypothetical protein
VSVTNIHSYPGASAHLITVRPHLSHLDVAIAKTAEGGCLCRAVRYRVSGVPLAQSRCHCRSCRLAVGAAGVAWVVFARNDFVLLQGTLARFRSSPAVVRTFCGVCGTSIGYEPADAPEQIEITAATFDAPELFPPQREVWVDERVGWQSLDSALRHYRQSSKGLSSAA